MRNKLFISESERQSILYQHGTKYGWLYEQQTTTTTTTVQSNPTPQPPVQSNPTPQQQAQSNPTPQPPAPTPQSVTPTCAQAPGLKSLDDEANFRSYAKKNYGSETVSFGKINNPKFVDKPKSFCNPSFKALGIVYNHKPKSGGGKTIGELYLATQSTTVTTTVPPGAGSQLPKVGEPLNANDIATLTSA